MQHKNIHNLLPPILHKNITTFHENGVSSVLQKKWCHMIMESFAYNNPEAMCTTMRLGSTEAFLLQNKTFSMIR